MFASDGEPVVPVPAVAGGENAGTEARTDRVGAEAERGEGKVEPGVRHVPDPSCSGSVRGESGSQE